MNDNLKRGPLALSERVGAVVDAWEEFLIVKSVLDTIHGCEQFLRRGRESYYDQVHFVLPDYPEIRSKLYFIEATPEAEIAARAAVGAAAKTYAAAFAEATRGRSDLAGVIARLGLPSPVTVTQQAQNWGNFRPWWRRGGAAPLAGKAVTKSRPSPGDYGHDEIVCINDPAAAIRFWRGDFNYDWSQ